MTNLQDIDIANANDMLPINLVVENFGVESLDLQNFGMYKAKIQNFEHFANEEDRGQKLVLVTAINPTPAGEGKTTVSVGLTDALNKIGKKSIAALREPSLGPVFGVKGGAAGGGYSQVVPMEDINLHFTGDFHAITSANNLLCALIDNHIKQGNELMIDPSTISFKRVLDINDRQLRFIVDGLQGPNTLSKTTINGIPREDGFDITVASEVMAIFCLSKDLDDLKSRLGEIIIGKTYSEKIVKAKDLKANGAMSVLLKDALLPNIVQTLEKNPVIIHGGPFANIAHGCNSVIATKTALGIVGNTAGEDGFVVTEAGFGADLGMEKFFDIKCRLSGLYPNVVVLVATIRALKSHGGVKKEDLGKENIESLLKGSSNLIRHLNNIKEIYSVPRVVALNKFPTDTDEEIRCLEKICEENGVKLILTTNHSDGSNGAIDLAKEVVKLSEIPSIGNKFTYSLDISIEDKIQAIVQKVYKGKKAVFSQGAKRQIRFLEENNIDNLPICMAKTQYSFSDDPNKLGAPSDFEVQINNVKVSNGAGFIVAISGSIMTMPGLPKIPAANNIDIVDGKITGLF